MPVLGCLVEGAKNRPQLWAIPGAKPSESVFGIRIDRQRGEIHLEDDVVGVADR
jgi:hypothetical protein